MCGQHGRYVKVFCHQSPWILLQDNIFQQQQKKQGSYATLLFQETSLSLELLCCAAGSTKYWIEISLPWSRRYARRIHVCRRTLYRSWGGPWVCYLGALPGVDTIRRDQGVPSLVPEHKNLKAICLSSYCCFCVITFVFSTNHNLLYYSLSNLTLCFW